jgi:hypothetical protein
LQVSLVQVAQQVDHVLGDVKLDVFHHRGAGAARAILCLGATLQKEAEVGRREVDEAFVRGHGEIGRNGERHVRVAARKDEHIARPYERDTRGAAQRLSLRSRQGWNEQLVVVLVK